MQNLFGLLILASLVQRIRCQSDYVTVQKEIESGACLESNFTESQTDITSLTTITVDSDKFDDYDLKKLFVKKFKLYKNSRCEKYKNESLDILEPLRKARAVQYYTLNTTVECHICYASGSSSADERCYKGKKLPRVKCADAEYCFTEIHPEYLRRGCILPGRVNRTFVCKCPLCNDKPSEESSHYEYRTLSDWAYDNSRLAKRLLGMDLICKVCETKGIDLGQDKICRAGKGAEYMICPHNHICYTNIDDEIDFVSRGCINKPAFNSIYFFCNTTACNNNPYLRPKRRIQKEEIIITMPHTNLKSLSILKNNNSRSTNQFPKLSLILFLLEIIGFKERASY